MIKQVIKKLMAPKNSQQYIEELRRAGVTIGEGTVFYGHKTCLVDKARGSYITIGRNCSITKGVIILAHDYSYSVLNDIYGVLPQNTAMTVIGDNVFIGVNSVVLMGSHIGNNVIIGAGSVVSGHIEDNSVYAGNPARKICTIEEYYEKHMQRFEPSAVTQAKRIKEVTGRNPTLEEMGFYVQLFNNDAKFYEQLKPRLGNIPKNIPAQTKYKSLEDFLDKYNI